MGIMSTPKISQNAANEPQLFMFDRETETMPRGELAALQLSRLRKSLARAYESVAHIRRKFDAAGVSPDALRSLADIGHFPLTGKADLRDNYPFGLFAVPREQLLRLHASSGTTGKPTVVGYTRADLDLWSDLMARTLACAGARPGDIVHNAYGYGLFTGGLGAHFGGPHRAASDADARFRRRHPVRHAVLCAQHRGGSVRHGRRHCQPAA